MTTHSGFQCNTTRDCVNNGLQQLCFSGDVLGTEEDFCACSPYFGWVGENCDEESAILVYNRIASIFIAFWTLIIILLGLRIIILNFCSYGMRFDILFFAVLCSTVGSGGTFIFEMFTIPGYFDADHFELITYIHLVKDSEDEIDSKGIDGALFPKIIGLFVLSAAAITLLLSWEEAINSMSKFQSPTCKKLADRQVKFLRILGVSYILILLAFLTTGYIRACFILMSIINIGVPIVFIWISSVFVHSLKDLKRNEKHSQLSAIIDYVILIRTITVLALTIASTANLTFVVLRERILDVPPGRFLVIHFIRDISSTASLTLYTTITWYVNSVTIGPIFAEKYPILCYIFKPWDAKNLELIPEEGYEY